MNTTINQNSGKIWWRLQQSKGEDEKDSQLGVVRLRPKTGWERGPVFMSQSQRQEQNINQSITSLVFPFWYLILRMRSWTESSFHFRGKKCFKMRHRINWSLKTRWHRPRIEAGCSGLWVSSSVQTMYFLGIWRFFLKQPAMNQFLNV